MPDSVPPTERHSAPTSAAPVSREVRRQAVLDAAKAYACSGDRLIPVIAGALLLFGIDIERDPAAMAAVSVLADCTRFGLEPSARALRLLGCGEAA